MSHLQDRHIPQASCDRPVKAIAQGHQPGREASA